MKGKSLQLLIDELNKAERHQVLNACKRSGDKRHKALYELMKSSYAGKEEFTKLLDKCSGKLYDKKYSVKEQDKIQRRFIDFSVKEIENIKIKNFLSENLPERSYVLSMIYKPTSKEIFRKYVQKTAELTENKNQGLYSFSIDEQIDLQPASHSKKETEELRQLLVTKNAIIQKNYHGELSRIYELLSLLQFEDLEMMKELQPLVLTDQEAETLIMLAAGTPEETEYLLARARFAFFQPEKFDATVLRTEQTLKKISFHHAYKMLSGKLALLKTLHGFHFGENPEKLFEAAKPLEKSQDEIQRFYFQLVRLLRMRQKTEKTELQKLSFSSENEFRKDFLLALHAFSAGDNSTAIKKLNTLAYCSNPQVSLWSKAMEIRIHFDKNNLMLCESLLARFKRSIQAAESRQFTLDSSKFTLQFFQQRMKGKKPEIRPENISCLHAFLLGLEKSPKSN